jgi:hypothetical protein
MRYILHRGFSFNDMSHVFLQKLVLSENSLSGALPPSWSGMAALTELWLEFNDVSAWGHHVMCGWAGETAAQGRGRGRGGGPAGQAWQHLQSYGRIN